MDVRFTKHAREKFKVLQNHGVFIPETRVVETVLNPEFVDRETRAPLFVVQGTLDQSHVLRVVYRQEENVIVIITFYPGRMSQYGKR
jgi:ribulose-5-phosphate 4-epimerase/fuculose-1-phosphate aldolase